MSGIFGNRAMRFLRRIKGNFQPKEDSPRYRRRLERELGRVSEAFEGEKDPVLIHTYGKVGSTAIHAAIEKLPGFVSFQTHFITEEGVARARGVHRKHDRDPIHLKVGEKLREMLAAHPGRVVRIVTLVREPVARAVSNLFENPALLVEEGASEFRSLPVERIVEIASEQVLSSLEYTERWFDEELSGLVGDDFFARDFDREEGFSVSTCGRFRILAGKLELLSRNGGRQLGEFLDLGEDLDIPKRRARSQTGEASVYEQVREQLRLPAEVLERVYASRVCRHFYTEAELGEFRRNWQA